MTLKAAAGGFVIFVLSVPVIRGQDDWGVTYTSTEICALKGSTVTIPCTFTYPSTGSDKVQTRSWIARGSNHAPVDLTTDSHYTGRVEYPLHENDCTLRIKDLRESDSAEYKFRFMTDRPDRAFTGSPGVFLSVTDLRVQVGRSQARAELRCHSRCNVADDRSYVWYNNKKKMSEETSTYRVSFDNKNSYTCAVKGHKDYRSPPVYAPKLPSVSVSPSAEIVEGSSVTLTCSSDANPAASYTWYKKGNPDPPPLSREPQLVFSSIQSSDSGQYYCRAENQLGTKRSEFISIDVKYAPKLPSVSVSPSAEIVEGSSVTLTCSSDANPAANYTWYKKGNPDPRPLSREPQLVFSSIQSSDSGQYSCTAENLLGRRSKHINVNVKYAPQVLPVSVTPAGEITEGSSVTLTCSSDANPAANYTWYKKGNPYRRLPGQEPQLVFSSIQSSDSGEYYCIAENQLGKASVYISINVIYAPKLPSVSVSPSAEIVEGSSVTLTCSSDANPAANYTWYKEDGNPDPRPLSREPQLVFSSIQSSDSGQYYCRAENLLGRRSEYIDVNVKYAPKLPSVSVSPSGEIVEGSSVTLTCSSDANPAANYTWYKENQIKLQGPEAVYRFTSISSEDRGIYYCKSENKHGEINSSRQFIDVQYAPKLPSVSVSPSAEIVEGSSVTLTCSSDANPAANYIWYKEDVNPDPRPLSKEPQLVFSSIQSSDSGQYYCRAENQLGTKRSEFISIDVKYAPKLPSVSVSPSAEIVEGSSVTLTCSSDANPAANYTWYKEDEDSPKASGQIFIITDFRAEHSGNYYCEAQNMRGHSNSTLHLTVVAGAWKLIAVATVPAFCLAIILISVFLWIIKRKSSKQPSERGERPDDREQIHPAEQQDGLHYASVHFSKKQADPVYSNIGPAQPGRYDEDETIVYAAVTFNAAASRTRDQEAAEDPAALYSTVNKKRNL